MKSILLIDHGDLSDLVKRLYNLNLKIIAMFVFYDFYSNDSVTANY